MSRKHTPIQSRPAADLAQGGLPPSEDDAVDGGNAKEGGVRRRRGGHVATAPGLLTRLSCRSFAANAVRLQLHALAYNLGDFLRTLAAPEPIQDWSLTSLKEKLIKIGAKVVSHGRLCRLPDGRSRDSENTLRRHPAADRGTAAAASTSTA